MIPMKHAHPSAPTKPRSRYYTQKMREKQNLTGCDIPLSTEILRKPETKTTEDIPSNSSASTTAVLPSTELAVNDRRHAAPRIETTKGDTCLKIEDLNVEGVLEKEKLAWMDDNKPAEKKTGVERNSESVPSDEKGLFEARFDHEGNILAPDSVVPLTAGLHHHGADCDKPGYTLDEIMTLLQSSSPPQKLWALKTFTAILHKAKQSLYDECLSGSLIMKMVEEDMILPLRFLLDSTPMPLIAATFKALEALLVNDFDEFMMDEILVIDKDPYFFELCPELTSDNETPNENDMPDAQLMKQDVVKGFLRTGILRRIEYLLLSFSDSLESPTIVSIFRIITRFVQHSVETAQKFCTEETALVNLLMSDAMTVKAPISQMRLVRAFTSVLGPLSQSWAMHMYHQASRWISSLRNVIVDTTVRDLVSESLNLLIVLAHYGFCPDNLRDVEDIFPQLIHSAAPKEGTLTVWDSGCSARLLTFLGLCLALNNAEGPVVNDAMASLVFQNVLNGYMALKNIPDCHKEDKYMRLKSAYLFYAAEYCRQERTDYVRLSTVMVRDVCEFIPVLLSECQDMITELSGKKGRVSSLSHADAECLPSYGVVAYGGGALHYTLQNRYTLSLAIHALDLLLTSPTEVVDFKAVLKLNSALDSFLKNIPAFRPDNSDFWMSYMVRVVVKAVRLSLRIMEVDVNAGMNFVELYQAALHLIPFMAQNQTSELTEFLTRIIFSFPKLRRSKTSVSTEFVLKTFASIDAIQLQKDAQTTATIFSDLKPLGLTDSSQIQSLAFPSRDATVFTSSWMLECFSYVQKWGTAMEKLKPNSLNSCVRGYFFWLTFCIHTTAESKVTTLRFDEIYVFMADFFSEEGWYRDPFVKTALEAILSLLCGTSSSSSKKPALKLLAEGKVKNKPIIDFYDNLLDDFVACSYGDPVFTQYVLVPTLQHQPSAFRAKFWGPEKQAWSVGALSHHNLCYPVKLHLDPAETSVSLLSQYFLLLMTQNITEKRTPLMYLIAVCHLHHFLAQQTTTKTSPSPAGQQELALVDKLSRFLQANNTSVLAQHILRYKGPSSDCNAVVDLDDDIPQVFRTLP